MTVQEIRSALVQLSLDERESIAAWLRLHPFDDDAVDANRVAEPAAAYRVDVLQPPYLSVADYLKFEEGSSIKHEYVAGRIFAMSGATVRHNVIIANLVAAFHAHLRGGPCKVFVADVLAHIKINRDDVFYYPDVMVACDPLNFEERELRNPKLVIEVLSPSTEATDRREKALNYRRIDALDEYVLIAQSKPELTIQRRSENWRAEVFEGLDAAPVFQSVALRLPLSQLYEGVPL